MMGRYGVMEHGSSGASAWLIFSDQNLRVQEAGWDNPSAFGVRIWIWEDGTLIHEALLPAGGSGSQNVPGNYRLRTVEDPEPDLEARLRLPVGVTYRMQWPGD